MGDLRRDGRSESISNARVVLDKDFILDEGSAERFVGTRGRLNPDKLANRGYPMSLTITARPKCKDKPFLA